MQRMNKDEFEGMWKQVRGKVRQKWGKLTNDDLERIDGDFDVLIGRLQERYGKARREIEEEVRGWLESLETRVNV